MAARVTIPVDAGSTTRFQFKNEEAGPPATLLYDFTDAVITLTAGPLETVWGRRNLTASTSDSDGITVDLATGFVTVELAADKTSRLDCSVPFDIEAAWPNKEVHRLLEGTLVVSPGPVRGDATWRR